MNNVTKHPVFLFVIQSDCVYFCSMIYLFYDRYCAITFSIMLPVIFQIVCITVLSDQTVYIPVYSLIRLFVAVSKVKYVIQALTVCSVRSMTCTRCFMVPFCRCPDLCWQRRVLVWFMLELSVWVSSWSVEEWECYVWSFGKWWVRPVILLGPSIFLENCVVQTSKQVIRVESEQVTACMGDEVGWGGGWFTR